MVSICHLEQGELLLIRHTKNYRDQYWRFWTLPFSHKWIIQSGAPQIFQPKFELILSRISLRRCAPSWKWLISELQHISCKQQDNSNSSTKIKSTGRDAILPEPQLDWYIWKLLLTYAISRHVHSSRNVTLSCPLFSISTWPDDTVHPCCFFQHTQLRLQRCTCYEHDFPTIQRLFHVVKTS